MAKNIGIKVICVLLMISMIVLTFSNISNAKFSMSYLYGNYDYISLVERTNGALNEVSPSYFDLNSDGTLKLNTVDSDFVLNMNEKGIRVSPFLSNHWDREKGRNALKKADKLVDSIVTAVQKYNLDGVNVDIENLNEDDKNAYTNFVKLLREKMPKDKTVSVAVAANPYGWLNGWQGSYDYEALGRCADYIMLMAYDEHYEGGVAGSVAGIEFVEQSIQYALKYIEKDKIVLGIPFYGRYWQNGASVGGYGVTINKIENIISKYKSIVTFDEASASCKAVVTINSTDICPVINGRALKAGTYTFWYENEESLTRKLELINKYELKGCGSWSLGQETEDVWNYYSKILNARSNIFRDVSDKYWAYEAIKYAKENGWIQGKSQNEFAPEANLTRAEFATIICRILNLSCNEKTEYYSDIVNYWANESICAITKFGIMNGYPDGSFKPDNEISREEVASVLCKIVNPDVGGGVYGFSDVSVDRWSYSYINKLSQAGIILGYENNEFRPTNAITRAEAVTMLIRGMR